MNIDDNPITEQAYDMFYSALYNFYNNPCNETIYKAYDGILACIIAGCNAIVPCDTNASNLSYDLYDTGNGWSYIICTNPSELSKCKGKANTIQPYLSVFERAAKDSQMNGIVFDPYNDSGATLHCSKVVCQKMMDAYYQMKKQ